eukprot:TRINITY_DN66213_c4_g7_i2.p1 TRINITY_DN66213_c4_g7~~TRINITY_DN66213_c4_g7_i2.p1  ORF type:complete len:743 (+),score=36.35 TRINITY_DN66213_c4_g7_i2:129-2231(+)
MYKVLFLLWVPTCLGFVPLARLLASAMVFYCTFFILFVAEWERQEGVYANEPLGTVPAILAARKAILKPTVGIALLTLACLFYHWVFVVLLVTAALLYTYWIKWIRRTIDKIRDVTEHCNLELLEDQFTQWLFGLFPHIPHTIFTLKTSLEDLVQHFHEDQWLLEMGCGAAVGGLLLVSSLMGIQVWIASVLCICAVGWLAMQAAVKELQWTHAVGGLSWLLIEGLFLGSACGLQLSVSLWWFFSVGLPKMLIGFSIVALAIPPIALFFLPLSSRLFLLRMVHYFKASQVSSAWNGTPTLHVRRRDVLNSTLAGLHSLKEEQQREQGKHPSSASYLNSMFSVTFDGEEGTDINGLTKAWLRLLLRDLVEVEKAPLFIREEKTGRLSIHPMAVYLADGDGYLFDLIEQEGLHSVYELIGNVLGKCLVQQQPVGLDLCSGILKYIIDPSWPVTGEDLQDFKPETAKHYLKLKETPDTIELLDLTFSIEVASEWCGTVIGDPQTVELQEGGENLPVTKDNYDVFVQLLAEFYLRKRHTHQLEALRRGVLQVVPECILSTFQVSELRNLWGFNTELTVSDWRAHTMYRNKSHHSDDTTIDLFWHYVETLKRDDQWKLFQWVTEMATLPSQGCVGLLPPFTIELVDVHHEEISSNNSNNEAPNRSDPLPSCSTCFNTLYLPRYTSLHTLGVKFSQACCEQQYGLA